MSKLVKEIGLICLIMLCSCLTAMAGKPGNVLPDIPITNYVTDYDANGVPYLVQSDGLGAYYNGVNGDASVLVANGYNRIVNGTGVLTWGRFVLWQSRLMLRIP
jgi:hypothetical protein